MRVGDLINAGERLGVCVLVAVESWHTIVVCKGNQYYRVSGLALKGEVR